MLAIFLKCLCLEGLSRAGRGKDKAMFLADILKTGLATHEYLSGSAWEEHTPGL